MLDDIAKEGGPGRADAGAYMRRSQLVRRTHRRLPLADHAWHGATRNPRQRARKRVMTDEEICNLWAALDGGGDNLPSCNPAYVRLLLLTALCRKECSHGLWPGMATMHRDNIGGYTGEVWTVPARRPCH
jgi:hypothetical protein